jgi:hypothetical protein
MIRLENIPSSSTVVNKIEHYKQEEPKQINQSIFGIYHVQLEQEEQEE